MLFLNIFYKYAVCSAYHIKSEVEMVNFINILRKHSNMEGLVLDESVVKVAKGQVKHMCGTHKLTHASKNLESLKTRLKKEGLHVVLAGENIALQHSYTKKNDQEQYAEIAKMWFKSKEHRKNILGDFTVTGVASCTTPKEKYWIQVFAKTISNKEIHKLGKKKNQLTKSSTPYRSNTEPEKTTKQHRKEISPEDYPEENYENPKSKYAQPENYTDQQPEEDLSETPRKQHDVTKTVTVNTVDDNLRHEISKLLKVKNNTKTVTVKINKTEEKPKQPRTVTVTQHVTATVTTSNIPTSISTSSASNTNTSSASSTTSSSNNSNNSTTQPTRSLSTPLSSTTKNEFMSIISEIVQKLKDEIYKEVGKEEIKEEKEKLKNNLSEDIKEEYEESYNKTKNNLNKLNNEESFENDFNDKQRMKRYIKEVMRDMEPSIEIA